MREMEWAKETAELAEKYLSTEQCSEVKSLLEVFLAEPSDDLRQSIERMVYEAKVKALSKSLKHPADLVEDGDYLIGWADEKSRFFLRRDEILRHVLITGSTGSGKTNVAMLLGSQMIMDGQKVWVLDWRKSWRYLFQIPEIQGSDILVFTVGSKEFPFHFNPLVPPRGANPDEWLKRITDQTCDVYFLGEGVKHLLHKALDHCYREFGVYDGRGRYPTFQNVLRFLENYKATSMREREWLSSALRAVEELCFGAIGGVLNQGNFPLEQLLDSNVIFELDALDLDDRTFVTGTLLLWTYFYRLGSEGREELKQTIFLEEAHNLIKRQSPYAPKEPLLDWVVKQIRELGVGIVIIDQDPSMLSVPVLNNTYVTIAMSLKEFYNLSTMRSALLLEDPSNLSKLPLGKAIVRLQDGRQGKHCEPFVVSIPRLPVDKSRPVPLDRLAARMGQYSGLLGIREEGNQNCEGEKEEQENREERTAEQRGTEQTHGTEQGQGERQTEEQTVDTDERKVLTDILENPVSQVVERYARLGMNSYRGNKTIRRLEDRGLIRAVNLTIGKHYWGKAFEFTEPGRLLLEGMGYGTSERLTKRHGGLKHQLCVKEIASRFREKRHDVEIEKPLGNGKQTDIVIDSKLAVEVEFEGGNMVENVLKNRDQGYRVIIACESEGDRTRLRSKLAEAGLEKEAEVRLLVDVLDHPEALL